MSRRRKLAIAAAALVGAAAGAVFAVGVGVLALIAYSDRRNAKARERTVRAGAPPAHPRRTSRTLRDVHGPARSSM